MESKEFNSGNPLALPVGYELHKRYKIGMVLGAGGFGITYKAFDTYNEAFCAIKEYVPLGICVRQENTITLAPANKELSMSFCHGRERFMEEAVVLLELADVPNIVHITDYFEGNGTAYYVMEFLDGSTMKQLQKAFPDRRIPLEDAFPILKTVGKALNRVHSHKFLLHRDISPENIFITKDKKVKLIDFGSAKHVSGQGNQNFSVVLKPRFAPPEQYRKDSPQGCYTDIYALASTFYAMVCGIMLPDSMERVAGAEYTPAYQVVPQMSRQMSAVLDKALQLDYRKRYQTVEQFIRELEEAWQMEIEPDANKNDNNRILISEVKEQTSRIAIRPFVVWKEGNAEIKKWYLGADTMISVGRAEGKSQIVLLGYPEISKVHCFIQYDSKSGKYLVKDVSTNGTTVKNQWLEKEQVYAFDTGSKLRLAGKCILELGVEYGDK